jgi:hypothetical protein
MKSTWQKAGRYLGPTWAQCGKGFIAFPELLPLAVRTNPILSFDTRAQKSMAVLIGGVFPQSTLRMAGQRGSGVLANALLMSGQVPTGNRRRKGVCYPGTEDLQDRKAALVLGRIPGAMAAKQP